jgi:ABC-type iron transport system FetAB ATPase subunit
MGNITRIIFKATKKEASLCDFCETLWLKGESINKNTGHPYEMARKEEDKEYTIEDLSDLDQEHRNLKYIHMK